MTTCPICHTPVKFPKRYCCQAHKRKAQNVRYYQSHREEVIERVSEWRKHEPLRLMIERNVRN